jgi:hypothetical protein
LGDGQVFAIAQDEKWWSGGRNSGELAARRVDGIVTELKRA